MLRFNKIAILIVLAVSLSHALSARADANPQFIADERSALERLLNGHKVINIVDDFLAFWDVAKSKTPFVQRRLWMRMVESKYRDYFDRAVYRDATPRERRAMLREFLIRVPSQVEAIRELNKTIYNNIIQAFINFKHVRFAEYTQQNDIYIGLSLFRFDGAVRAVQNDAGIPDTLCLGMEALSTYSPEQVRIAITHEFFHLYHFSFLFRNPSLADFRAPHMPLIIEGMAVAGTEECYPFLPRSLYLHFTDEEIATQQRDLSVSAARFLELVKTEAPPESYEQWFTNNATDEAPSRGGYLLGYEVAKRVLADYTLEEMVRMSPAELRALVEQHLNAIAGNGVLILASTN
ncbi:MAG TPA: DUF2268 domain-containing putative Zn-dependent protease [Blastocatellia bacterium]|nr:DUF2268 domain-containing putative Zn-dependent protease [Blastocatellia bacterium]